MKFRHVLFFGAAAIAAVPAHAAAQDRSASYEIHQPAQSLATTLFQISRVSGVPILFTDPAIKKIKAPAVNGRMSVEKMLRTVLAGSRYTYRFTEAGSVRIERLVTSGVFAPPRGNAGNADTQAPADAEIVVVGTQIRDSQVGKALPVTTITEDQVVATGAVSGDELFRAIPQMGDVNFNSSFLPGSSNSARGDVGSLNLRNLGIGYTLLLVNGRRTVVHPASRNTDTGVPVFTYNSNIIPVSGIDQMSVLRDGAAAIYGSDAVAGVVNAVLRKDFKGLQIEAQTGFAEGTHLREQSVNLLTGFDFGGGKGNITISGSYLHGTGLRARDQDYTASGDLRSLFAGTRFDGATSLDGRSTISPWGGFQVVGVTSAVRANGVALTNAIGQFHIQPQTNTGCALNRSGGVCIDDGTAATAGVDRNLRQDTDAAINRTILPAVDRGNLYLNARYEIEPDVELFGEAGLYLAQTRAVQSPTEQLSSQPITVPAGNYWNPFGPTTFGGVANPNRIPGLTIPASGLPVTLQRLSFVDAGPDIVTVDNSSYRFLGGIRFPFAGLNWEAAALYSEARVKDTSDGISATQLQRQLGLSTPDAFNPFSGGDPNNPTIGDSSPNSQAAIDAIRLKTSRISKSSLALADLKASSNDLFSLPGGPVGIAFGAELRRETGSDNRDPHVDGTLKFTDIVTGTVYGSDLLGTSASPDTTGSRSVVSAYAELAVPLISPDMDIPLVNNLEMQLAGRFENYSDVGSVAKPKIAAAWDMFSWLRFRGSYSEGFKAPNLEQINASVLTRSNLRADYVRCEQDLRAGRIANFANCSRNFSMVSARAGNPDLKPETSTDWTVGIVIQPDFLPSSLGRITLSADYWSIKQKNIVSVFGDVNALISDYLLRTQGSSNPNVVRAAPTPAEIDAAAGTGLAPVGVVLSINDDFRNSLPQRVSGVDLGLNWRLKTDKVGTFNLSANVAYLEKYRLQPNADVQALIDAQEAGAINAATPIAGTGNRLRQNGRPKWKWSATLTWTYDQFQLGAYTQYTGSVEDTGLIDASGVPWLIEDRLTGNLYGQLTVGDPGGSEMRLRIGVRNITNEAPPLSSQGYLGTLYNPYGRYFYSNVRLSF